MAQVAVAPDLGGVARYLDDGGPAPVRGSARRPGLIHGVTCDKSLSAIPTGHFDACNGLTEVIY
jgi:hypothetical protein